MPTTKPKVWAKDDALYIGDNGRCLCGRHLGASGRFTGRDLSGQKLHRVTAHDQQVFLNMGGDTIACETCIGIALRCRENGEWHNAPVEGARGYDDSSARGGEPD